MKYVAFGEAIKSADGAVIHEVEYGARAENVLLADGSSLEGVLQELRGAVEGIVDGEEVQF